MFKLNTIDPSKALVSNNVSKIRSLLSKTIVDVTRRNLSPGANPESPVRKRLESNLEQASIKEIKTSLQKGYLMTKHSTNTSEPHVKFVYISPDCKNLCWKSLDKEDEKSFPLKSIIQVVKLGVRGARRGSGERGNRPRLVVVSSHRQL